METTHTKHSRLYYFETIQHQETATARQRALRAAQAGTNPEAKAAARLVLKNTSGKQGRLF